MLQIVMLDTRNAVEFMASYNRYSMEKSKTWNSAR
jgi:hypothetical protein